MVRRRPPARSQNRQRCRPGFTSVIALMVAGVMTIAGTGAAVADDGTPNSSLGYPTFQGEENPIPDRGVAYDPSNSYLQKVFEKDVAQGAGSDTEHDFWVDRLLVREGAEPSGTATDDAGKEYTYDSDKNTYLFSRGRAAFMRSHDPKVLGFGGDLAYWDTLGGKPGFVVSLSDEGEQVALQEDASQRKQTPSYWRSVFTSSDESLTVVETKYITEENVLVSGFDVTSNGGARELTISAKSDFTSAAGGDELTGRVSAANKLTTLYPRLSGNGLAPEDGSLTGTLSVPAGGSTSTKVQMGLITKELAGSKTEYEAIRDGDLSDPAASYKAHVTAYNQWWADNIPYIETPEQNIDKTLFYRWWLTRFNYLDADMPGNTFQFPTSIEGVLGYNNAIALTVGMFIQDTKWLRDPAYSYGPWVSAGETAGDKGQYRDNPGDPANWSASYTQYITESAWQSYQVHGGPTQIAEKLGDYGAADTNGILATMDENENFLLETNWNAWTGNDADAVSFEERKGQKMDRAESAYVYSGAIAAAEAYRLAGNEDAAAEMDEVAGNVKNAVLTQLWNKDDNLLQHSFVSDGELAKWKEVNNYYPYAVGLMPSSDDEDYNDDYEDAFRLFSDADQYPVFPFFTANQADKEEAGNPGTNNFAVINSQVIFRIYQAALRNYNSGENGYITPEQYKQLLYWNAYAHYQGGDNRYPDQNEFWAQGSPEDGGSIGYRSWIHHTQLGTTNWTVIEDVAGLVPRTDEKIELDPIALPDWNHFTVNNLSYHGSDVSIVWNNDGAYDDAGAPKGYTLYVNGEAAFTVDSLAHVIYDPATGEVEVQGDSDANVTSGQTSNVRAADQVTYSADDRVTDVLAKAGTLVDSEASSHTNLADGAAVEATFEADNAKKAASTAVDGSTVAQKFWSTKGSDNDKDSLTVNFDEPTNIDDVRAFFYQTSSSNTESGYLEPAMYTLEYRSGDSWEPLPDQARTPAIPQANFNRVQFPSVTADAIRVTVTPQPGQSVGIKEIQAYSTGLEAPESTNVAPSVDAYVKAQNGTLTGLGAIVKDDGLPGGDLESTWSVISAPKDGEVTFKDVNATNTTVQFSAGGTYTLQLAVSDGELEGTDEVTVEAPEVGGAFNVAPTASEITASYTAGWNNIGAVNNGTKLYSGGDNSEVWGTWSGDHDETQWLKYDWDGPVRLNSASISFWYDNGDDDTANGVAVPESWKLQAWDASANDGEGAWTDIALKGDADYPREKDEDNQVEFAEPIFTSKLRAVFSASTNGSAYAAVGVSEFEAFAEDPLSVETVDVATSVGELPELPATVSASYGDGTRADLAVQWPEVTDEQVAAEGELTLDGTIIGAQTPTTGTVWVRSDLDPGSLTLNGAVDMEQTVYVGASSVDLPSTATGIYNNGIRQSGLPVEWDQDQVDAIDLTKAGEFTVDGVVTDENTSGTADVTLTVHVIDPDAGTDPADPDVDRSTLEELIAKAQGVDRDAYTEESVAALDTALAAGTEVLEDDSAVQEQIDAAAADLQEALDGLVESTPGPGTDPTDPGTDPSVPGDGGETPGDSGQNGSGDGSSDGGGAADGSAGGGDSDDLAWTGANVGLLIAGALALLLGGVAITSYARRRRS